MNTTGPEAPQPVDAAGRSLRVGDHVEIAGWRKASIPRAAAVGSVTAIHECDCERHTQVVVAFADGSVQHFPAVAPSPWSDEQAGDLTRTA